MEAAGAAAAVAVGAAAEDLVVAAVQCVPAADSRPQLALVQLRGPRHVQVRAARGRAAVKLLDPGRAPAHRDRVVDQRAALGLAAEQSLARDPAALPAQERGQVVLEVESAKAAPARAVCQALALERGLEQAAISPAAVRRLANSVTFSTSPDPPRARLGQAGRDVPAQRQPTSCNKVRLHSDWLSAERLLALEWQGSPHSSRRAVRIGPTSALDKSATDTLVPVTDPQIQSLVLVASERTLVAPELPI